MTQNKPTALAEQTIVAYSDGACKVNIAVGGWGCHVQFPDGATREANGFSPDTTNNRAELRGCIAAFELTPPDQPLKVILDSDYVRLGITERLPKWKANGWRISNKKPVKNKDLWERLEAATVGREVTFERVKSHSGNVGNDRADELANMAICKDLVRPVELKETNNG